MDYSNRADRVDSFLAWRSVNALERIANFCDAIMYGLILYSICYTAILVVEKFRGGNE